MAKAVTTSKNGQVCNGHKLSDHKEHRDALEKISVPSAVNFLCKQPMTNTKNGQVIKFSCLSDYPN